jgi:hypothetical protein
MTRHEVPVLPFLPPYLYYDYKAPQTGTGMYIRPKGL